MAKYNVSKPEAERLGIARVKVAESASKSSSKKSGSSNPTSDLVKGYDEGIKMYTDMLPTLKPRYDALAASIEAEKQAALQGDSKLAGEEQTTLKQTIAQRGLEVNSSDSFYSGEKNKLQENQNVRSRTVATPYETKKAELGVAQVKDEADIKTAVASLLVNKGTAKYQAGRDAVNDEQWQKTFDFTKSEAAADRAIQLRKMALDEISSKTGAGSKTFGNDLATMMGTAYAGGFGSDYDKGIREVIKSQLEAKHGKSKELDAAIQEYFPNGWEGKINKPPVSVVKEVGDWVYYSDGTRENSLTGEVQAQK